VNPDLAAARLHDIQGLDPVSIWPLAPGWWLIMAALLGLWMLKGLLRHGLPAWRRSRRTRWHRDASRRLYALRARVNREDAKTIATELSELLRRIAIARCGRDACAGLSGDDWLDWLASHDPYHFDWKGRGRLLLNLPYAPPVSDDHRPALHDMINATQAWISQGHDCGIPSGSTS
jgi:hypothetical protein